MVLSVSGTKTLNGEHISTAGSVIHDCHAEILAKRCLRRYLYSELYKYVENCETEETSQDQNESIFELNSTPAETPNSDQPQPEVAPTVYNGFRLKKGYSSLHHCYNFSVLYIPLLILFTNY